MASTTHSRSRRPSVCTRITPDDAIEDPRRNAASTKRLWRVGTVTTDLNILEPKTLWNFLEVASEATDYAIGFSDAPTFVHTLAARCLACQSMPTDCFEAFLTALIEWYNTGETDPRILTANITDDERACLIVLPTIVQQVYLDYQFSCPELVAAATYDATTEFEVLCKGCHQTWDGSAQCTCGYPGCGYTITSNVPLPTHISSQ